MYEQGSLDVLCHWLLDCWWLTDQGESLGLGFLLELSAEFLEKSD